MPRRNRRPRRIRPARFPRQIERQYAAKQRALYGQLYRLFDDLLIPRLPEIARMAGTRADAMRLDQSPWRAMLNQLFGQMRARWEKAADLARENARLAGQQVSTHNREQIRRQMRQAVGFDMFADDPDLVDLMEQFEADAVSQIVTIDASEFPKIERIVANGFQSGIRASDIADQLVDATGTIVNRAMFWARDQIGTLNAQLTQSRQESLGINEYTWRTSLDERVRESHRQLEGTTHSWDDPPTVGKRQVHPGEDYICRCTADPKIPGVEMEMTSPADVPRNPELVKRARARAKRLRDEKRRPYSPPRNAPPVL